MAIRKDQSRPFWTPYEDEAYTQTEAQGQAEAQLGSALAMQADASQVQSQPLRGNTSTRQTPHPDIKHGQIIAGQKSDQPTERAL